MSQPDGPRPIVTVSQVIDMVACPIHDEADLGVPCLSIPQAESRARSIAFCDERWADAGQVITARNRSIGRRKAMSRP